ncbi:hypothetical protein ACNS7O_11280 [Haloferacaceae archaeon DSL9]
MITNWKRIALGSFLLACLVLASGCLGFASDVGDSEPDLESEPAGENNTTDSDGADPDDPADNSSVDDGETETDGTDENAPPDETDSDADSDETDSDADSDESDENTSAADSESEPPSDEDDSAEQPAEDEPAEQPAGDDDAADESADDSEDPTDQPADSEPPENDTTDDAPENDTDVGEPGDVPNNDTVVDAPDDGTESDDESQSDESDVADDGDADETAGQHAQLFRDLIERNYESASDGTVVSYEESAEAGELVVTGAVPSTDEGSEFETEASTVAYTWGEYAADLTNPPERLDVVVIDEAEQTVGTYHVETALAIDAFFNEAPSEELGEQVFSTVEQRDDPSEASGDAEENDE